MPRVQTPTKAFTLIELLIVVAIIAILAAIAVPNFLEAQTRSKVSRVLSDQRSIATAIHAYTVDTNHYPMGILKLRAEVPTYTYNFQDQFVRWRLKELTTPVSYITALPETPFQTSGYVISGVIKTITYNPGSEYDTATTSIGDWYNFDGLVQAGARYGVTKWHLRDAGPDRIFNNNDLGNTTRTNKNFLPYDPTNGTLSVGDIWKFGP
jgi:prepilin-type N-terminal cleavage/methylation domain-containing protein